MSDTTVLCVTSLYDCENQYDCVKIDYVHDMPGMPGILKTDWVYTRPLGDWSKINFSREDGLPVERFLETMVVKNLDVLRKMCLLLLKKIGYDYWEFLYLVPILDPTFEPPIINHRCRWQRDLADSIVSEHFHGVISTCINTNRLQELYYELVQVVKYQKKKNKP